MTEQGDRQAPGVEALTEKIRQLVHEGNTRRVVVRNGEGERVLDIPVTAGVVAAVAAPVVTAVAAFAALAGPWSVGVERQDETPPAEPATDTARADAAAADVAPADTAQPENPPTDADAAHGKES
ncbi:MULTISPECIES: DUF4342 domain-containing protein [Saccharothrix]|uniref:DUF4342 domain-containing protein n=1 Tax=Saccharothrix TaxID=2071 RepID=UPI00093AD2D5|nr:DUF4342 domain-containing protein [Saccharothrix sp. CB00851]